MPGCEPHPEAHNARSSLDAFIKLSTDNKCAAIEEMFNNYEIKELILDKVCQVIDAEYNKICSSMDPSIYHTCKIKTQILSGKIMYKS